MDNRKLEGTLRGHDSAISSIELFYLPTALTFTDEQNPDTHHHFLKPSLLTGDSSGIIIWWDITTRRPLKEWQAHGEPDSKSPDAVITLQQLGITWKLAPNGEYETPQIDNNWFGCFLSHGKDGVVNIWRLFDPVVCGQYGINFQPSASLHQSDFKAFFSMPVNMLNFSNVELLHDWLVTPATQDSNNFDVYEIKPPENSLHRILKGVDVTKFGNIEEPKLEDSMGSLGLDNRRGFGIIMKIAWIDGSHLVVAYENGYVVTFEHSDSIQAVAFNRALSPEPVTSLLYDGARDILLAASASDKLCIIKASQRGDTTSGTSTHRIRHRGIGDLAVSTDGTIGLITWDGYARFFHYNEDKTDVDFVFKVKRQMPSIADNRPNSTDDIKQQDFLHPQKSSVVAFSRTQVSYRKIKEQNQIEYNNGMSKNLIRRRLERDFDHHWMLIGYKDGRVAVYNVT